MSRRPARPLVGIDFSGARDAGRRIWIAEGRRIGGMFHLESCRPAAALPGAGAEPARALPALAA